MIATSQPLASAAGLQVLREGGNAVDAAITAAAVLSVVEPTMNGVGGDLFAIVWDARRGTLRGLNASGRSAHSATPETFKARKLDAVPARGPLSVTVPGVVDGWATLVETCGTIPLSRALAPAIEYARRGYPVSEIIAGQWREAQPILAGDPAAAATFLSNGQAPRAGELFANPNLATTLERIAAAGRDAFYRGPVAAAIVADMKERNGLLDSRDFADHASTWVEPIATTYRGYEVHELPPNTQGFVALEMLNLLEGFDLKSLGHNSAAYLHLVIEAKRIAFADRAAYLADPDSVSAACLKTLVSKEYAASRRLEIDPARAASPPGPARLAAAGSSSSAPGLDDLTGRDLGDTIYLTVVDGQGNAVSLIQSLFESFGAGIVAGETGIALHNRGSLFTLKDGHPNRLAPHKRPMHTLLPAMVLKDGKPWLTFGVMGGDMQPQGHVQVLANLIDFGMNVQEAGEVARVRHTADGVMVESGIPAAARVGLAARGHRIIERIGAFGGFQGILIEPRTAVLMGGSDPRKDGLAIGY